MYTNLLAQLACKQQACTLKELAQKLGTSIGQLNKWRKSTHTIPSSMTLKLEELANLGGLDLSLVEWAGSIEDARKWEKLLCLLADDADETSGTGYDTPPLTEESESLCLFTVSVLNELGVPRPTAFPQELGFVDLEEDALDWEDIAERIKANPYAALIRELYEAFVNVYGFYAAFISNLVYDDELCEIGDEWMEIESALLDLAACKIEIDKSFAPNAENFKFKTLRNYRKWLTDLKNMAIRKGIPLRAELLDLVHCQDGDLCNSADRASLGFNDYNLHPDIYMNELLVGMRTIHQVLPVIMKKLDVYDTFFLNEKEFNVETSED